MLIDFKIVTEILDTEIEQAGQKMDHAVLEGALMREGRIMISLLEHDYQEVAALMTQGLKRADMIGDVSIKVAAQQGIAESYNNFRDKIRDAGLDLG